MGKAAQKWGPNSEGTKRALAKIDESLSTLIYRLNQTDMLPHVNIVITGDHGITRRPQGDKQIEIGKVLRDSQLLRDVSMIVGSGAYSMIHQIYPELNADQPNAARFPEFCPSFE